MRGRSGANQIVGILVAAGDRQNASAQNLPQPVHKPQRSSRSPPRASRRSQAAVLCARKGVHILFTAILKI
jgi:hypothetical protein